MKKTIKLGIVLLLISGLAGVLLGFVHDITLEPIAKTEAAAKQKAMNEILPDADEFKVSQVQLTDKVLEVNEGYKDGKIVGYAIKVSPKGYSGAIEMMVGVSTSGEIGGIKILKHTETPGLGANAPNPEFSGLFAGKSADSTLVVVKGASTSDNQISAITGATITSKAVVLGVNDALEFYNSNLKGE